MNFSGRAGVRLMLVVALLVAGGAVLAQPDSIRVMNYNLTNYGNYTTYCTAQNNALATKDVNFEKVLGYFQPHIFGVNEINSSNLLVQRVKANVLNANGRTWYEGMLGGNLSGSDIVNAFFWDARKIAVAKHNVISAPTRSIDHFKVYPIPVQGTDTLFLNIFMTHLKAGNTASDATGRANMVAALRTWLAANMPDPGRAIFMGDLNTYNSSEVGYQNLVNPTSGTAFKDPVNKPGNWNNNSSFAAYHTQSPRTSTTNGCLSGGGLDDRFDQILMTQALLTNSGSGPRLYYSPGSYWAFGNDGRHYNQDITAGTNNSIPAAIAQALYNGSDHLPITAKLVIDGLTATRTPNWPQALEVRFLNRQDLLVENADGMDPVSAVEVLSVDGRRLEAQTLKPVSGQTVRLNGAPASQVLLVRVTTARSTYTKRLLVPRV